MVNYQIVQTQPAFYLDKSGKAIQGFTVYVYFPEFDEQHLINVPSLAEKDVKPSIEMLLAQRQALAKWGSTK
jgi:hypothetical protein